MWLDAENLLCPIPISPKDHAKRALAVFLVSPELPGCRGFAGRARDGVSAAVKFFEEGGDGSGDGVLDILMNAGRQLFVRSIRDFSAFVFASDEQRAQLVKDGLMLEPQLIEAYRIRGLFLDACYHGWHCFEFTDTSGTMRYLRYRLIPGDRGEDRGLPKPSFQANGMPSMEPIPDDPRAEDFLRQDFIYKVQNSDVRYILQGQLHDAPNPPEVNSPILNPAEPWNEKFHPWLDLCEIVLEQPILENEVMTGFATNPNRSPECIKIPLATSPDHYASLGQARAIIYPGARAARAAAEKPQNN